MTRMDRCGLIVAETGALRWTAQHRSRPPPTTPERDVPSGSPSRTLKREVAVIEAKLSGRMAPKITERTARPPSMTQRPRWAFLDLPRTARSRSAPQSRIVSMMMARIPASGPEPDRHHENQRPDQIGNRAGHGKSTKSAANVRNQPAFGAVLRAASSARGNRQQAAECDADHCGYSASPAMASAILGVREKSGGTA